MYVLCSPSKNLLYFSESFPSFATAAPPVKIPTSLLSFDKYFKYSCCRFAIESLSKPNVGLLVSKNTLTPCVILLAPINLWVVLISILTLILLNPEDTEVNARTGIPTAATAAAPTVPAIAAGTYAMLFTASLLFPIAVAAPRASGVKVRFPSSLPAALLIAVILPPDCRSFSLFIVSTAVLKVEILVLSSVICSSNFLNCLTKLSPRGKLYFIVEVFFSFSLRTSLYCLTNSAILVCKGVLPVSLKYSFILLIISNLSSLSDSKLTPLTSLIISSKCTVRLV